MKNVVPHANAQLKSLDLINGNCQIHPLDGGLSFCLMMQLALGMYVLVACAIKSHMQGIVLATVMHWGPQCNYKSLTRILGTYFKHKVFSAVNFI